MTRINVYTPLTDEDFGFDRIPELVGHFDSAKAESWDDRDYNGNGSRGTRRGTGLYRTAGGKWVLEFWSSWQNEGSTCTYISDGEARDWLLRNHEDEAIAKHFGDIPEEEDRRPGRPRIGGEVLVRLGDLLGRVDACASENGLSRAETVRQLVTSGLTSADATKKTDRPLAPSPSEHNWRCHYCGMVARDLPVSGSRWVDILIHDYHPYAMQACPECWGKMNATAEEQAERQNAL